MLRERVESLVTGLVQDRWPEADLAAVRVEPSRETEFGDLAVNAAMVLARQLKRPPREIAGEIVDLLKGESLFRKIEIAGPGFLNLFLDTAAYRELLGLILEEKEKYGLRPPAGSRQQIEFVSANPTGPLNVVSARAAAIGDTLARLFEAAGIETEKEFYVNDHGSQTDHLVDSVLWHRAGGRGAFPEEGYRGEYVNELALESVSILDPLFPVAAAAAGPEKVAPLLGSMEALAGGDDGPIRESAGRVAGKPLPVEVNEEAFRLLLRAWVLEKMLMSQKEQLRRFGVRFDRWFRESELHTSNRIAETLDEIEKAGDVFEKEGARWFRSTRYGDDEDRVLIRSDGRPTYFLADISYHDDKIKRGYDHVIDILGPDHHGHIPRMQGAVRSLGREEGWLEIMIVQQVNLIRGGEKVKMSKRAGEFVTLDDLVDEVGVGAARFFFVSLRPNSHLNFDLDLATSRSMDNPVYYVQYAHARICSIFEHARAAGTDLSRSGAAPLDRLDHKGEIDLLKTLDAYPDTLAAAAATREPHRLPVYLKDLAARFHTYYHKAKIVTEDEELTLARLALVEGIRIVLQNGLDLLGVEAPEAM